MHIRVGLLSKASARCLRLKLAESDSMQRLANMHKAGINKESQEYKAAYNAIETESDRIFASEVKDDRNDIRTTDFGQG